jgi:WD40 repeat protein
MTEELAASPAGAEAKEPASWDNLEAVSKIISAIAIPVVIAIGGWWIQNSITKQSISKDYVALAISVLEKPKGDIDQSLRDWAVDLLDEYAPSKFPAETVSRLKAGSISLGALTAALSSKASGRVAISPVGRSVAIGGRDNAIQIVDLATGGVLAKLLGHEDEITGLAFGVDGHRLFSGSLDKTVREWDVAQHSQVGVMPFDSAVFNLAISPDGSRLIVGLEDNTFLTLDVQTHNLIEKLKLP